LPSLLWDRRDAPRGLGHNIYFGGVTPPYRAIKQVTNTFPAKIFSQTSRLVTGGIIICIHIVVNRSANTIDQELPLPFLISWVIGSFLYWGYVIAILFLSLFSYSAPDPRILSLLGLLGASPIYCLIGASLTNKRTFALGILLAMVNILSGCVITAFLTGLSFN
jgi:hypothetical protein